MLPDASAVRVNRKDRRLEILAAQVRLLYDNANLAVCVNLLAATILAALQWGFASGNVVIAWWVYMAMMSAMRFALSRRFHHANPDNADMSKWSAAYAVGVGMAGAGWGGSGILLYSEANPTNQVFLAFVLGGMMLGGASLLAPRPEAFLAFLIPTGLAPAFRLLAQGDQTHLAMGVLALIFTVAVLITTGRIFRTIDSSIRLQFQNHDLLLDLHAANSETEALNQELDLRVQERTSELLKSTEYLQAEIKRREQMEEELLRARKLESLGVLAGGIAHDFNNFLTIIQGNIELAKQRLNPKEPLQRILNEAASTCLRATSLSSQLLTFAKGGEPVRRLVSVAQLVMDAVHLVRAGTPISITVDIAEDLRFAQVDPGQIGQALHNILLNARQAMPEGGIIEVRAENVLQDNREADPRVRISIRDYGCGIPADIRPRIFDPYFTTKEGGSGLGLATAYAIVARHGGHIFVDSVPGVETEFTVELPASYEVPDAPAPVSAEMQTGIGLILVMDDEELLRNLLDNVLTSLGYEVQTARDGAEAIALYEQAQAAGRRFDAVLLDLTVSGGMGGIETAAKLKEMDPSSRLIVSSGYSASPVMADFAGYGFDAVVPKPWKIPELSEVIRNVLLVARDRTTE